MDTAFYASMQADAATLGTLATLEQDPKSVKTAIDLLTSAHGAGIYHVYTSGIGQSGRRARLFFNALWEGAGQDLNLLVLIGRQEWTGSGSDGGVPSIGGSTGHLHLGEHKEGAEPQPLPSDPRARSHGRCCVLFNPLSGWCRGLSGATGTSGLARRATLSWPSLTAVAPRSLWMWGLGPRAWAQS